MQRVDGTASYRHMGIDSHSMSIPDAMPKIRSDAPWIPTSREHGHAEKARGCMTDPTETILAYLRQVGAGLDPDFLREAVRVMSALLMEIEVQQQIGADRYERTEERTTYRNGYRERDWQTRVGDVPLKIPKLREGSYFPSLLEPRRQAEQALLSVIQQAYIQGVR